MAMLICEGTCNPTLHVYDWFASRYAEALAGSGVTEAILDAVTAQRRFLRHTDHAHQSRNLYFCLTCGCERQYGPRDWALERAS